MELRRKSRMTSEVSTSSLSDIMFFLMLFFLIVATMVTHSVVKVNLPTSKTASPALIKQKIVLAVDSNMNYYLNNEKITFAQLEPKLTDLISKDTAKEPTIVFQASKKLQLQDVVDVMGVGTKLKMKLVLATTNK